MASSSPSTPTVLLLNLPPKTFVGINLASFNSSPNFHGITNLPTGLHFLYTGTDASLSIRHGHWLQVSSQTSHPQTYVLRWNHEHESLDLLDTNSATAINASRAVPSLQCRGLVDYTALRSASTSLQTSQTKATDREDEDDTNNDEEEEDEDEDEDPWPTLTSHISPLTLKRILDRPSTVSTTTDTNNPWTLSSISTAPQDTETIPGLSSNESSHPLHEAGSSTLGLLPINLKQTWPPSSLGRDRTHKARDKSWYLGSLIDLLSSTLPSTSSSPADRQRGAKDLLGELQFCFLMVLTLANYSCLEQWKRLLAVAFGCRDALGEVQGYFVEVVKVLRAQLGRVEDVEGGLFEMGDELGSSWLRSLLGSFKASVDEVLGDGQGEAGLKEELGELAEWLRETYGWADEGKMLKRGMVDLEDGERVEMQLDGLDEEEESGEYAPVVVEM